MRGGKGGKLIIERVLAEYSRPVKLNIGYPYVLPWGFLTFAVHQFLPVFYLVPKPSEAATLHLPGYLVGVQPGTVVSAASFPRCLHHNLMLMKPVVWDFQTILFQFAEKKKMNELQ